jgi:DNA-binding CsgD family transcriptional regulator
MAETIPTDKPAFGRETAGNLALHVALEVSLCPSAVVDRTGSIAFANRAAEALFRAGLAFASDPARRLRLLEPADDASFRSALHRLATLRDGTSIRWSKPRSRTSRCSAIVTAQITPMRADATQFLVLMFDSRQAQSISPGRLGHLLGLSDTESRLVAAIACGDDVANAAASAGVRVSSARTYLKRIFSKTSTHRQTQLVALVYQLLASDLAIQREPSGSADDVDGRVDPNADR